MSASSSGYSRLLTKQFFASPIIVFIAFKRELLWINRLMELPLEFCILAWNGGLESEFQALEPTQSAKLFLSTVLFAHPLRLCIFDSHIVSPSRSCKSCIREVSSSITIYIHRDNEVEYIFTLLCLYLHRGVRFIGSRFSRTTYFRPLVNCIKVDMMLFIWGLKLNVLFYFFVDFGAKLLYFS